MSKKDAYAKIGECSSAEELANSYSMTGLRNLYYAITFKSPNVDLCKNKLSLAQVLMNFHRCRVTGNYAVGYAK